MTFAARGIDPREYGEKFEQQITSTALSLLSTYITCFCKPTNQEDFQHGLLSQWRGYGVDGGYALQFSRKKLLAALEVANQSESLDYDLLDVHYDLDNPLKTKVLQHSDSYMMAYSAFLDEMAQPLNFARTTMPSPIAGLLNGSLEALLNYLSHTKNTHFREERECRLSLVQATALETGSCLPVSYYDRVGIPVPFTQTPKTAFNLLQCVDWIIVGPAPRLHTRLKAVTQLSRQCASHVMVRPSHIPFTRF